MSHSNPISPLSSIIISRVCVHNLFFGRYITEPVKMLRVAKCKKPSSSDKAAGMTKKRKMMTGHSRRNPSQYAKSRQLHTSRTVTAPVPFASSSNGFVFNTKSGSKKPITLMTQGRRTIMIHNSPTALLPKTRVVMKVLPTQQQQKHPLSPSIRSFATATSKWDFEKWDEKAHDKLLKDHFELKKFWSTPTPERDTKFKQIILQREIGLEDFQAILSNSFHLLTHKKDAGSATRARIYFHSLLFPWHLTLTSHRRYLGSEDSGSITHSYLFFETRISEEGGDKVTLTIDDKLWWDWESTGEPTEHIIFRKFTGSKDITAFGRKLLIENPSPIPKLAITSITVDNIDLIDGLFDKVNIYDLVPKGKILSYFFTNPDLDWMFDNFDCLNYSPNPAVLNAGVAGYFAGIIYPVGNERRISYFDLAQQLNNNKAKEAKFLKHFDRQRNQLRWDIWDENSPDYSPTADKYYTNN